MRRTAIGLVLTGIAASVFLVAGQAAAYPTTPVGWTSDFMAQTASASAIDAAYSGGYLHIVRKTAAGEIRYTRLSGNGTVKDKDTRIDLTGGPDENPTIAAKQDGNVMVAYVSRDPASQGGVDRYQLCVRSSTDFGTTWRAGYAMRTNDNWHHRRPRFGISDNGSRLLAYEDYESGHSEVCFREVTATTWTNRTAVSAVDEIEDRCPSVCGFAAQDYAIAYVHGDAANSSIVVKRYQSGTFTFTWTISPAVAGHNKGYPDIVSYTGNRYCVVWNDNGTVYERRMVAGAWQSTDTLYTATGISNACPRVCYRSCIEACRRIGNNGVVGITTGADYDIMTGVTPFDSPRTLALAYDIATSNSYLVVSSNTGASGEVYVKRTDSTPPAGGMTVNGEVTAIGGADTYVKQDFAVSFKNVIDDWNRTGTEPGPPLGAGAYTNGVTKIEILRATDPEAGPGSWTSLATIDNAPWNATVRVGSSGLGEGGCYLKGILTDTAGNTAEVKSGRVVVDLTAPNTKLVASGTAGTNGWLRSHAKCVLNPGDENADYTEYMLENTSTGQKDANWTRYNKSFKLTDGRWKVYFRTVDKAGNVEIIKFDTVNVDTVAPEAFVLRPDKGVIQTGYYTDDTFRLSGTGSDENGLSRASIWIDGKEVYKTTTHFKMAWIWKLAGVSEANHTIAVKVKDVAGNSGASSKIVYVGNVAKDWYFAEGNSLPEFDEWLCVLNPGNRPANYQISFMLDTGEVRTFERSMAPRQRDTVKVKDYISDPHTGVSVKIHSDNQAVVAERPMYFVYKNDNPNYMWKGGHNVLGINTLQREWYFAEGTTRFNDHDGNRFEQWLCLQNPSDYQTATVVITYMLGTGHNIEKVYHVAPHSRKTIEVATDVGVNQDVSTKVFSDVPIAAERPMYFDYHGFAVDGSDVVGATGPSTTWSFAEGCTRAGFQEWLTIQNPNNVPAECDITYLTGAGKKTSVKRTIQPRKRETVDVLSNVGDNQDVSINMTCDVPVIAERPMYYIYGMDGGKHWNGGDSVVGNPAPSTTYFLAEGTTISNFDTYYTLLNPRDDRSCTVAVEYIFGDGTAHREQYSVAPHTRLTINVRDAINRQANVSGSIVADFPIVIERPMYFDYDGRGITGGHDVSGYGVD